MKLHRILALASICCLTTCVATRADDQDRQMNRARIQGSQVLKSSCPNINVVFALEDDAAANYEADSTVRSIQEYTESIEELSICAKRSTSQSQDDWLTYFLDLAHMQRAYSINKYLLDLSPPQFAQSLALKDQEEKESLDANRSLFFLFCTTKSAQLRTILVHIQHQSEIVPGQCKSYYGIGPSDK